MEQVCGDDLHLAQLMSWRWPRSLRREYSMTVKSNSSLVLFDLISSIAIRFSVAPPSQMLSEQAR
jgi:hypothetical protein